MFFIISCQVNLNGQKNLNDIINTSLQLAVKQYALMNTTLPDTIFPRSVKPDGSLWTNKSGWWTSGFFPGSLWYLYEFSNNPELKEMAIGRTRAVENEKWNFRDHDIGFKIFCSFGNGLRLTGDTSYIPVILTAAKTLTQRYNPVVGCIRSWGLLEDENEYLVIIDNMMNLELLFRATKQSGDSSFFNIAISHADKTLTNHFRPDGSSYHVLNYDPKTGEVIQKRTAQGYADESAWARGQAWGFYGYTMAYSETGYERYLEQAQRIADFILNHPDLPEDKIPYWDFNAPDIPDALRDASAGAIIASALLELSTFTNDSLKSLYLENAEKIILTLSSESYRSESGENHNFLLRHGVGNIPSNSEVDVPLSYADYYYIEAMMRYNKLLSE